MDKFFLSPVPEFEDPVALDHFSEVFEAVASLLTQPFNLPFPAFLLLP